MINLYHNEDMERSVLGAIMMEPEAIYDVITLLSPEAFYNEANKKIFAAIYDMHRNAEKIDILTVTEKLKKKGEIEEVGGPVYITNLSTGMGSAKHIDYHARIVYQAYVQREATQFGHNIFKKAQDPTIDVNDLIDEINTGSQQINELTVQESGTKTISSLIDESLGDAEQRQEAKISGKPMGVRTPIKKLDDYTNGWQKGDLVIIAARPGMGKTAFMLAAAKAGLKSGDIPLMFSLEMSAKRLVDRMIIGEADINSLAYRNGNITAEDWSKIEGSIKGLYDSHMLIDDKPFMTIDYIHSMARIMVRKGAASYIMIDYLQLIKMLHKDSNMNREQEVSHISRMLKMMARELNIPVILFAQLNREVEKSAGMKRPELWHLRESGCLTGDTKIYLPTIKRYERIDNLEGKKNLYVLSHFGLQNHKTKASSCFTTGIKEVYELELNNGKKIKATGDHKIFTDDGWIELKDINDEKVALPINIQNYGIGVNHSELKLLGHLISNGCVLKKHSITITINNEDMDLCDKIDGYAKKALNGVKTKWNQTNTERSKFTTIFFESDYQLTHGKRNPVSLMMEKYGLFDKRSKEKFIPDKLFFMNREESNNFLSALFSGDGTVYYREDRGRKSLLVSYSSASEELIDGVQQLLLNIGVISIKRKVSNKKHTWYHLDIKGKANLMNFYGNVGFDSDRKSEYLRKSIEKIKNIREGWKKYKINENESICYMKVKNISYRGEEKVYDIEVPHSHNFMANGIVVHNSIEQDADIVGFMYRAEKYGIQEYEGNVPSHGLGELILAKFREGPTGVLNFRYNDSLTKIWSDEQIEEINPF